MYLCIFICVQDCVCVCRGGCVCTWIHLGGWGTVSSDMSLSTHKESLLVKLIS